MLATYLLLAIPTLWKDNVCQNIYRIALFEHQNTFGVFDIKILMSKYHFFITIIKQRTGVISRKKGAECFKCGAISCNFDIVVLALYCLWEMITCALMAQVKKPKMKIFF